MVDDEQPKKDCEQQEGQDISLENFAPEKFYINRGGKKVEVNPVRLRHPHYALQGDKGWMKDPAAERSSALLMTGGHRSNPKQDACNNNVPTDVSCKDGKSNSHSDASDEASAKTPGNSELK